jgi:hypothetical protein
MWNTHYRGKILKSKDLLQFTALKLVIYRGSPLTGSLARVAAEADTLPMLAWEYSPFANTR